MHAQPDGPGLGTAILVGTPVDNGSGTEIITYRYPDAMPAPPTSGTRQFLRLTISQP